MGNFQMNAYSYREVSEFNYLYIMPGKSKNIFYCNKTARPAYIHQHLYCAPDCGYPGGGNTLCHNKEDLKLEFTGFPARAYIHLWKKEPENIIKDKPDMIFIIDIV